MLVYTIYNLPHQAEVNVDSSVDMCDPIEADESLGECWSRRILGDNMTDTMESGSCRNPRGKRCRFQVHPLKKEQ